MPEIQKMFDAEGKETLDPARAVRVIVQTLDKKGKLLEETVFHPRQK
jgi:hypothetical protein